MAPITRQVPDPIYRQISAWLTDQIHSGKWPEHFKLKSEVDLAAELGVNRGTVRKAIEALIAQGLLVRIHGRGTFVASKMLEQPLAERLVAVSEDLIEKGIPFETIVLEQAIIPAPNVIALSLGVPEASALFYLSRKRLVRQEPLIMLNNYVVLEHCPDIGEIDFTKHRLFHTLEERYHLPLDWGRRVFQAQSASLEIAELLGILSCDPIMYLEQTVYLRDGTPLEFSQAWIRGDRFRLSSTLQRETRKQPTTDVGAPRA